MMPSSSNKFEQYDTISTKKSMQSFRMKDRDSAKEVEESPEQLSSMLPHSTQPFFFPPPFANTALGCTNSSLLSTPYVSPHQGPYTFANQFPVTQHSLYNLHFPHGSNSRMGSQSSNASSGEVSMSSYPLNGGVVNTSENFPMPQLPSSRRLPPGYVQSNYPTPEISCLSLPKGIGNRSTTAVGCNTQEHLLNAQQRPLFHHHMSNHNLPLHAHTARHVHSSSQIQNTMASPVRKRVSSSSMPITGDSSLGVNHPIWFSQSLYRSGSNSHRVSLERSTSGNHKSYTSTSSKSHQYRHASPKFDSVTNMSLNSFKAFHPNVESRATHESGDVDSSLIISKRTSSTGSCHNHHSTKQTPSPPAPTEHRNKQRLKQLTFGRVTTGYRNYRLLVPTYDRQPGNEHHPVTPRVSEDCSKRKWDAIVASWRRALHKWDHIITDEDAENLRLKKKLLSDGSFEKDDRGNAIGFTMGELGLAEVEERTAYLKRIKSELDTLRTKVKDRREHDNTDDSVNGNGPNWHDDGCVKHSTTITRHSTASQQSSSHSLDNFVREKKEKYGPVLGSDLTHAMKDTCSPSGSVSVDDVGVIGSREHRKSNLGNIRENSAPSSFTAVANVTRNEYIFLPSSVMTNYSHKHDPSADSTNRIEESESSWKGHGSASGAFSGNGDSTVLAVPVEDNMEEVRQDVMCCQKDNVSKQAYVAATLSPQHQQHYDPHIHSVSSNVDVIYPLNQYDSPITTCATPARIRVIKPSTSVKSLETLITQRGTSTDMSQIDDVVHTQHSSALLLSDASMGGKNNCITIFYLNNTQYSIDDVNAYFLEQEHQPQGVFPPIHLEVPPEFLNIFEPTERTETSTEFHDDIKVDDDSIGHRVLTQNQPTSTSNSAIPTTLSSECENNARYMYIVDELMERIRCFYDVSRLYWIQERGLQNDRHTMNVVPLRDENSSAFLEFSQELLTQVKRAIDFEAYSSVTSCPLSNCDVSFSEAVTDELNLPQNTQGNSLLRSGLDVPTVSFPCLIYAVNNLDERYNRNNLGTTCVTVDNTKFPKADHERDLTVGEISDDEVVHITQSKCIGNMTSENRIQNGRDIQSNNTTIFACMDTIDSQDMEGGVKGDSAYNGELCAGNMLLRSSKRSTSPTSRALSESMVSDHVSHDSPVVTIQNSSSTDYSYIGVDPFSRSSPMFHVDPLLLMNDNRVYTPSNMNSNSEEMERLYMMWASHDVHDGDSICTGNIGSAALLGSPPPTPCGGDDRVPLRKSQGST